MRRTEAPVAPVIGGKGDAYGSDDRTETFEGTRSIQRLAEASAMLTFDGFLDPRTNALGDVTGYRVNAYAETLRIRYRVCPDVRFANQAVPGFCSETLVAPDSERSRRPASGTSPGTPSGTRWLTSRKSCCTPRCARR